MEMTDRKIPEYIDRHEIDGAIQYPRQAVTYAEAPGFLQGAIRYVPESLVIALREEVERLRQTKRPDSTS